MIFSSAQSFLGQEAKSPDTPCFPDDLLLPLDVLVLLRVQFQVYDTFQDSLPQAKKHNS